MCHLMKRKKSLQWDLLGVSIRACLPTNCLGMARYSREKLSSHDISLRVTLFECVPCRKVGGSM